MSNFGRLLNCCIYKNTNLSNKIIPQRKSLIQNLSSISNSTYIANGAHGKVFEKKKLGKHYACKKFLKPSVFKRELKILNKIKNSKRLQKCIYANEKKLCIYNEYISGMDMFYFIEKHCLEIGSSKYIFDDIVIKKIGKEILLGLEELKYFGFVHLDIKLENLIINKHLDLKIIDFDTGKHLFKCKSLNKLQKICGTHQYVCPEVLGGFYTETSDIWSLGVILWILKTGDYPYDNIELLKEVNIKDFNNYSTLINEHFKCLMESFFVLDPYERITIENAINHDFFD
jgi:serine/threonine protein kinase